MVKETTTSHLNTSGSIPRSTLRFRHLFQILHLRYLDLTTGLTVRGAFAFFLWRMELLVWSGFFIERALGERVDCMSSFAHLFPTLLSVIFTLFPFQNPLFMRFFSLCNNQKINCFLRVLFYGWICMDIIRPAMLNSTDLLSPRSL